MVRTISVALFCMGLHASTIMTVSSPGGSYSAGTGPEHVSFTISPWSFGLTESYLQEANVGVAVLPQVSPGFDAIDVGRTPVTLAGDVVMEDVYFIVLPSADPGKLLFNVQLCCERIGTFGELFVETRFPPVTGLPGSTQAFGMEAYISGIGIPEPANIVPVLLVLIILAICLMKKAKAITRPA